MIALAIVAALLGWPGPSDLLGGTTPVPRKTLAEADQGGTVEVRVGETVTLRLHENASTGYRWAFDDLDTNLVGAREDKYIDRTGAVGSGGTMQWILEAKAPGTAQVKLKLLRQWEGDSSVQKRFAVTLIIRP